MKKFLSMVMAAAMVVSLVPATAFAQKVDGSVTASATVEGALEWQEGEAVNPIPAGPEVQLKINSVNYNNEDLTNPTDYVFNLILDNATFDATNAPEIQIRPYAGGSVALASVTYNPTTGIATYAAGADWTATAKYVDDDEIKITLSGVGDEDLLQKNDIVAIQLGNDGTAITRMDKTSKGRTATVAVESDTANMTISNDGTAQLFASVGATGISVSVRKLVDIAVEDYATVEDITIKPAVGDNFAFLKANDQIKIRPSSGFEFTNIARMDVEDEAGSLIGDGLTYMNNLSSDDELVFRVDTNGIKAGGIDKMVITGLQLDASNAKEGAVATLKFYATGCDTVSVEVANAIGAGVVMSVDEDEDVPQIYSGVNVDNDGITDDSEHESREITIKESFVGAWDEDKDFTLSLPEGVYVTDVTNPSVSGGPASGFITAADTQNDIKNWFADAYDRGDNISLDFKKRTWTETSSKITADEKTELTFTLELVADPNFEGDVVLTISGDAIETQEVTIAKFVKPYTVEAQQNDLQIDYRNTEIPTSVVIKETEAGLWDDNAGTNTKIRLALDKIEFDDAGTAVVDEKSGMEISKLKEVQVNNVEGILGFDVEDDSVDEPASVTVSGMQLYMNRSLPAGKYDLSVYCLEMDTAYNQQAVLSNNGEIIDNINDDFYSTTVKEGFVNIVTAGREDADSFTTKLVIPIGSTTMTAGENQVTLDAPAYISADGYTMLPLRAVATALGIPNESVLWDGATRTVTIMYGSKVIVMTVGQKTMYLNGSPVPASAAPEITNERTFLPVRDLGTALGVSDLTWDTDPATGKVSTVYVNANK